MPVVYTITLLFALRPDFVICCNYGSNENKESIKVNTASQKAINPVHWRLDSIYFEQSKKKYKVQSVLNFL